MSCLNNVSTTQKAHMLQLSAKPKETSFHHMQYL